MASLPVYNRQGEQVGAYEVDPSEFADRISKQLLHDAVVMYLANRRQGTAKNKSRSEVAGSTRKLYRQKGTGNARMGARRTNIRRGGGRAHPKRPRDWGYRLPRKALRLATRMAMASRIADEEVILLDELEMESPKTRVVGKLLEKLGLEGKGVLVATAEYDVNVYKSVRNIAKAEVLPISDLNAYAILRPRRVIMTKATMDALRERVKAAESVA
ncbi:50S ribosomal protein L4 [Thermostilla marina]